MSHQKQQPDHEEQHDLADYYSLPPIVEAVQATDEELSRNGYAATNFSAGSRRSTGSEIITSDQEFDPRRTIDHHQAMEADEKRSPTLDVSIASSPTLSSASATSKATTPKPASSSLNFSPSGSCGDEDDQSTLHIVAVATAMDTTYVSLSPDALEVDDEDDDQDTEEGVQLNYDNYRRTDSSASVEEALEQPSQPTYSHSQCDYREEHEVSTDSSSTAADADYVITIEEAPYYGDDEDDVEAWNGDNREVDDTTVKARRHRRRLVAMILGLCVFLLSLTMAVVVVVVVLEFSS